MAELGDLSQDRHGFVVRVPGRYGSPSIMEGRRRDCNPAGAGPRPGWIGELSSRRFPPVGLGRSANESLAWSQFMTVRKRTPLVLAILYLWFSTGPGAMAQETPAQGA